MCKNLHRLKTTKGKGCWLASIAVTMIDIFCREVMNGNCISKKSTFYQFNHLNCRNKKSVFRREVDETPKECALREHFEETCQQVSYIEFIGLIKK